MNTVAFRTIGGDVFGYGHFYRCFSLAHAIIALKPTTKITFIVNNALKPHVEKKFDVVVVDDIEELGFLYKLKPQMVVWDSYLGNNRHLVKIKKQCTLLLFDDNNDIYDSTIPDILVNGNLHALKLKYDKSFLGRYLLGPEFLVMRQEYWHNDNEQINVVDGSKHSVLITTGGSDQYEVSFELLMALRNVNIIKNIVIGPGYSDNLILKLQSCFDSMTKIIYQPTSLKNHINSVNFVITAGGSTVYEVLSQKVIPIIFSMADNQDMICSELNKLGAPFIGKYPSINYRLLPQVLSSTPVEKIVNQNTVDTLIDGKGAERVAKIIITSLKGVDQHR